MGKKNVCVVFGGRSTEHEVSLRSAASVLRNIDTDKYDVTMLGITADGRWLLYRGSVDGIEDGSWQNHPDNVPASISPDSSIHGIVALGGRLPPIKVDVAFPVLHGVNGEDGTIQGLFELAGIPYVGPGVAASANCMDKSVCKVLLEAAGIKQARWVSFDIRDFEADPAAHIARIEVKLGYPVFVKPSRCGSSIGISKARDRAGLESAVREACRFDRMIVVEEYIDGIEVEVAVLGNRLPRASVCGQILPCNEFYDYDAKYVSEGSKLIIPAPLDEGTAQAVRRTALKAYGVLGCRGMSRVDFFVRPGGDVVLGEINTIPGFTSISMYPKLFEASGLGYGELISELIALAEED